MRAMGIFAPLMPEVLNGLKDRAGPIKLAAERCVVHATRLHDPDAHAAMLKGLVGAPAEPRREFAEYCRRAVAKLAPDSGDEGE